MTTDGRGTGAEPGTYSTRASDSPGDLSPWSCFNCRRRKARCNRTKPCVHCAKSGLECTFPVSGRMPTRQHGLNVMSSSPAEKRSELVNRVKYLESIVEKLSTQISSTAQDSAAPDDPDGYQLGSNLPSQFATLRVDDGGSMYVGNRFWAVLNQGVQEVRRALEEEGQKIYDEFDVGPPNATAAIQEICRTPFTFGQAHTSEPVAQPLPSQVFFIWQTYVENVDPLIKILHVPTMNEMIRKSKGKFDNFTPGMRALMFAICLAAITSMSESDVQQNFNDYKASMVSHFMRGTEQALSVAGVMDTTDIRVVQAFSIYLEVAGVHYGTRGVWIMTGTLARTAASMGLHRDGSNFDNISYFEAEMRRRLWWQICFLDRRIAQCDVPEMAIGSGAFDTRPPANVNDADLSPGMTHEPVSRKGFTEMSFCLAMCDLWYLGLKVHRWVPVLVNQPNKREAILATAMKVIDDARKKIQNDVITGEGPRTPIQCFVEFIVALTLNQFEIICQHTEVFLKNNRPAGTPVHPNNSFRSSVECLRQLKIWKEHPATRQWAWIFVNYHQWHAAGIIFASLAPRRWDAEAEEGWKLAMTFVRELPIVMKTKNPLRPTLLSLIAEARGQRTREFARLQREGGPSCPLTEAMNDGGQVCSMSDLLSSTRTEPMATDSHDMGCKSTNTALDINQCSDRLKVYKSSVAGTELSWENLVEGNTNSSPSGSSNIGAFTTQQDDAFFALNILGDDGAMYPKNGLDDPFLFGGETNNSGENVFVCNNGGGAGNNHLQYHDTGIDEEFLYI